MTAANIQWWPPHMMRAVSSSFTLGSLNGQVQPIFSARPRTFADPFEQRWFCTFKSPPLGEKETYGSGDAPASRWLQPSFREVEGRIAKLRGTAGAVRIYDPFNNRPAWNLVAANRTQSNWSDGSTWAGGKKWTSGLLPPFIVADEDAEIGATFIVVRGLPVSLARVLRIGDPYEVIPNGIRPNYGCYHKIVDDTRSTASGKAGLYFQPGLRVAVKAGDMIRLNYPTTVMALVDDKQGEVQRDVVTGSFGVTLVEVLPSD